MFKKLYNIIKHKHVKDTDIVTENSKRYAKIETGEWRMDYGLAYLFDSSGENNLTRGIPIRLFSKIICDSNGQPRYHCRRNHPILIIGMFHFNLLLKIILIVIIVTKLQGLFM